MVSRRKCKPAGKTSRLSKLLVEHGLTHKADWTNSDVLAEISEGDVTRLEPACLSISNLFDIAESAGEGAAAKEISSMVNQFLKDGVILCLAQAWKLESARKFKRDELAKKNACILALSSIANYYPSCQDEKLPFLPLDVWRNMAASLEQAFLNMLQPDFSKIEMNAYVRALVSFFTTTLIAVPDSPIEVFTVPIPVDDNGNFLFGGKALLNKLLEIAIATDSSLPIESRNAIFRCCVAVVQATQHITGPEILELTSCYLNEFVGVAEGSYAAAESRSLIEWIQWSEEVTSLIQCEKVVHVLSPDLAASMLHRLTHVILGNLTSAAPSKGLAIVEALHGTASNLGNTSSKEEETDSNETEIFEKCESLFKSLAWLLDQCSPLDGQSVLQYLFSGLAALGHSIPMIDQWPADLAKSVMKLLGDIFSRVIGLQIESSQMENESDSDNLVDELERFSNWISAAIVIVADDMPTKTTFAEVISFALEAFYTRFSRMLERALERAPCKSSMLTTSSPKLDSPAISNFVRGLAPAFFSKTVLSVKDTDLTLMELARQIVLCTSILGQSTPFLLPLDVKSACVSMAASLLWEASANPGEWGFKFFGISILGELIFSLIDNLSDDEFHPIFADARLPELMQTVLATDAGQRGALKKRAAKHHEEMALDRYDDAISNFSAFADYKLK